jgi:hypothetical protein
MRISQDCCRYRWRQRNGGGAIFWLVYVDMALIHMGTSIYSPFANGE